jgi:histidinol-phosphate aminotransferase
MKFDASVIARPHIKNLRPYKAGMTTDELARQRGLRPEQIIKLASNENPYGMSPKVAIAVNDVINNTCLYPDIHDLTSAIAAHTNLNADNIILGNGSTDVLDMIARVFLGKDTEAISSQYGFSMYETLTGAVGAVNVIVPARDYGHYLHGFEEVITDKTKVIWIANPNNPTGTFVPYAKVKQFLAAVPSNVIVVLDEAYYEYLDSADRAESHLWIQEHPNLVVVRTFSKIHGLAGLRVGYGMGHPSVVGVLNKVRQPCNINSAGLAAAVAALGDQANVKEASKKNRQGLKQLRQGFDRLGLSYLPAYGNFLTVKFANASAIHDYLLGKGIIVRPLGNSGLPDYLRISVGRIEDNTRLLKVLKQLKNL